MADKPEAPQLTEKQQLFVLEYLKDYNGTRAAIAAGYAKSGAAVEASRMLMNAKVQELLTAEKTARKERLRRDGDDVIRELEKIAYSNILDYVTWTRDAHDDVKVLTRPSTELPEGASAAVVEIARDGRPRLYDKFEALKMLAQHYDVCVQRKKLDVTTDQVEVSDLTPQQRAARIKELMARLYGPNGKP